MPNRNTVTKGMFSNILVPVDGSEISYKALETALDVAKQNSSKVTVIHALEKVSTSYLEDENTLQMNTGEGQSILDRCRIFADEKGVSISTALVEGKPAFATILDFALKDKFDLIVIGSHGISGFKEHMLGSVSNKIVHHALLPILLIK
ncbi:MAG TPA: universal stress protein [Nitrososphaeraceae archaeon]|jgi:nucleotide-binding universal stress UspA family protein